MTISALPAFDQALCEFPLNTSCMQVPCNALHVAQDRFLRPWLPCVLLDSERELTPWGVDSWSLRL